MKALDWEKTKGFLLATSGLGTLGANYGYYLGKLSHLSETHSTLDTAVTAGLASVFAGFCVLKTTDILAGTFPDACKSLLKRASSPTPDNLPSDFSDNYKFLSASGLAVLNSVATGLYATSSIFSGHWSDLKPTAARLVSALATSKMANDKKQELTDAGTLSPSLQGVAEVVQKIPRVNVPPAANTAMLVSPHAELFASSLAENGSGAFNVLTKTGSGLLGTLAYLMYAFACSKRSAAASK
jgi:hypothetical protein